MFRKLCSSWIVVIDTVFLLSVLFALNKADRIFLLGRNQELGMPAEADGATCAMQDACLCHARCRFSYPQGQASLVGLSWKPVLYGLFLMSLHERCFPKYRCSDKKNQTSINHWGVLMWLWALCHCCVLASHANRRWRWQMGRNSWGSAWCQDP